MYRDPPVSPCFAAGEHTIQPDPSTDQRTACPSMKEAAGSMSLEQGIGPNALAAPHSNGITVIVVGLGIAGLTAAIESHRKGHMVITLDKWSGLKPHGTSQEIDPCCCQSTR